MRAVATLTSSESRRFIAKAVVQMPAVRAAWEQAYLLLSDGTTNAFVAQELLGNRGILPQDCTVGMSTNGRLCVNSPRNRNTYANVFYRGEPKQGTSFAHALADYDPRTVVLKGANAIDPQGVAGILTTGFDGGTIPRLIGPVTSNGLTMIVPVGLEKLVPSVPEAAKAFCGVQNIDISLGASGGMFCLHNATVVTEIEAARILFDVSATLVCCGGIGGNQGAVTLVFEGEESNVRALMAFIMQEVKGEPPIEAHESDCEMCRYTSCYYYSGEREE